MMMVTNERALQCLHRPVLKKLKNARMDRLVVVNEWQYEYVFFEWTEKKKVAISGRTG
jgi:hypothetical protein